MGFVAAGATELASLDFNVLSGSQAPPNGSLITLVAEVVIRPCERIQLR
jgi:hypothetical protein